MIEIVCILVYSYLTYLILKPWIRLGYQKRKLRDLLWFNKCEIIKVLKPLADKPELMKKLTPEGTKAVFQLMESYKECCDIEKECKEKGLI